MIIRRMHWEFQQRVNKLDSSHKKDLTPMERDAILNNAIHLYTEIFYSGSNPKKYKLGFEVTQQRLDMLSSLVVGLKQPVITPDNVVNGVSEFYLDSSTGQLIEPYIHFLRAYTNTNCGLVDIKLERHNDLNKILQDPHRKPSDKWKRKVAVIQQSTNVNSEKSLFVYSESPITEINIEYLRKPIEVYFGNYDSVEYTNCINTGGSNCTQFYNFSGSADTSVDCDLPIQYHDLVVDIAVQEFARILGDVNRFNLTQDKFNNY